jgi:Zn finger protein HypA/HybF involved in hydrogenase expression
MEAAAWFDNMDRDEVAEEIILSLPAADVAPIVHGEWLAWETEENVFECPFCHKAIQLMVGTPADNGYRYCPGCGAELHALYEKQEADHA